MSDPLGTGEFIPTDQPVQPMPGSFQPGDHIGPFKLLQLLGEGGMGSVYVADQSEPVRRRVALKVIKPGIGSDQVLARFEQERQALALMDHPNIAKVLDAGVTATRSPYIVMELIKGVPITKYCDDAKLTPRQRLELFIPVCQAVQHAHQKGIIHRDLKPSNILIALYDGKPVPKIIDFGVAKATGPRLTEQTIFTDIGGIIGTLEYMAPEQAELNNLDIDTRADIYALGVILYELLTGSVPFSRKDLESAGFGEMLRVIKEVEPTKPSTKIFSAQTLPAIAAVRQMEPRKLAQLVRGELDWITMKALEKERSRRYGTANGLALDIQRYLADEPVMAGPPSAGYRVRKFVRRHKLTIAAVTLVMAMCGGLGGSAIYTQYIRQKGEQDVAYANEVSENFRRMLDWERAGIQLRQVKNWLTESPEWNPRKLRINPNDRNLLKQAMMENILDHCERISPVAHAPELTLALLHEAAVRIMIAAACGEYLHLERGIRHLERTLAIGRYLVSTESGMDPDVKRLHGLDLQSSVVILDFRERAGMVDGIELEISKVERRINQLEEVVKDQSGPRSDFAGLLRAAAAGTSYNSTQALIGIKGAILARRREFSTAEKLLLARYSDLYGPEPRAIESLPQERRTTIQRLVSLYSAWGRKAEEEKWQRELNEISKDPYVDSYEGEAHFRAGRFDQAIKLIARSDDLYAKIGLGPQPANLALSAMVQFRRGNSDEAKAALKQLRALMENSGHAESESNKALMREAEALIGGN